MHRALTASALAVLIVAGCGRRDSGESAPSPSAATSIAPASATSSASPPSSWADHSHETAHGGRVRTAIGGGHLELKLTTSGRLTLWLLDDKSQPRSAKGASGTARLSGRAQPVPLRYDRTTDALVGDVGDVHPGVTTIVDARVEGAAAGAVSARFNVMPLAE